MKFAFAIVALLTAQAAVAEETPWLRIGTARPAATSPLPTCDAPEPSLCPPPIKSGFEAEEGGDE